MIKTTHIFQMLEVGKIKIGMKGETRKSAKGSDYKLPVKLDHFIVTTTEKGADGNFLLDTAVMKKLGDKPTEIPIKLPFDDIDLNFFTQYQYYHGKKAVCKGSGVRADRITKEGKIRIQCDPETCEYSVDKKCKVSGVLSCMLPDSPDLGGIYRFRTHGWNSVTGILASLMFFQENTNGVLQGLPMKLKFLKKNTEEHGAVPVVTIVLDGVEIQKFRQLAHDEAQSRKNLGVDMEQIEYRAELSGFTEDKDDPADIQAEFYPEPEIKDVTPPKGVSSDDLADKLQTKASEPPPPSEEQEKTPVNTGNNTPEQSEPKEEPVI
ncbi:MAG: hypothetical protein V3V24_09870 [Nitrospinaceae bacterium]